MPRVRMAVITMPTVTLRLPSATDERHCPPMTAMMTQKPVRVARLSRTGMVTR
jgi:hypothetical protein